MGILDAIVEWIAKQVMNGLDLISVSVLGALGCDMGTFLRYFPAAETMYQSPLPARSGKPAPGTGKYKHEPGDDDEEREHLQQALDYETGRIMLEKTDEIGEDGDGGTSRVTDYAGAGYVSQAASVMQRILTQLAEDNAYARYEEELSEELQAEADQIRYGNAHRGCHVNINRMSYVDNSYMEAYQKVAPSPPAHLQTPPEADIPDT